MQKKEIIDPFVVRIDPPLEESGDNKSLQKLKFGVKTIIPLKGYPLQFGNRIWDEMHRANPSLQHAACVSDLLKAGASCVGTLLTSEFAFDIRGSSSYGIPLNPKARDHLPGGSSSGSASAVASGEIDFALGTDTGGSIRIPAAYCGIWSLRPTPNLISMQSILPVGSCYDTVGIMAKDAAVLDKASSVLLSRCNQQTTNLQHLYVISEAIDLCTDDVKEILWNTIAKLKGLFSISIISIDAITGEKNSEHKGLSGWKSASKLMLANTWETLHPWLEKHIPNWQQQESAITEEVRLNLIAGQQAFIHYKTNPSDKEQTLQRVKHYTQTLDNFLSFEKALLLPTVPHVALTRDEQPSKDELMKLVALTSIASLAGLPQLHMPIAENQLGLPLGMSLIGKSNQDTSLLKAAVRVEAYFNTKLILLIK